MVAFSTFEKIEGFFSMKQRDISPNFPYCMKTIEIHGSTIKYVDEGSGDPILFLHGNPTSSYLWRNVIAHLTPFGRCIAPDLIGMGESDKPDIEYRFFDHYHYIEKFIEKLNLKNIVFVIHDWGSALGFYYSMKHEDNVKGLAFMEAIIGPVESWNDFPRKARLMFKLFRTPYIGWLLIGHLNLFIEKIMPMSIIRELTLEEKNRYRNPYPSSADRVPIWRWPNEIPIEGKPDDVHKAVVDYKSWLQTTEIPKLLVFAHPGALLRKKGVAWCQKHLKNLTEADIGKGIHYIQEDNPDDIGQEIAKWLGTIGVRNQA